LSSFSAIAWASPPANPRPAERPWRDWRTVQSVNVRSTNQTYQKPVCCVEARQVTEFHRKVAAG
jgi:hypothetical protein